MVDAMPTPERPNARFETLHATCVTIAHRGVLLLGSPGTGKSDLALRLIDRGATLVSDDGVIVSINAGRVIATAPATIAGKMEIRGLGIVDVPVTDETPIALCVTLEAGERMPPDPLAVTMVAGVRIPTLALAPFEASAPIKVERGLQLYGLPL